MYENEAKSLRPRRSLHGTRKTSVAPNSGEATRKRQPQRARSVTHRRALSIPRHRPTVPPSAYSRHISAIYKLVDDRNVLTPSEASPTNGGDDAGGGNGAAFPPQGSAPAPATGVGSHVRANSAMAGVETGPGGASTRVPLAVVQVGHGLCLNVRARTVARSRRAAAAASAAAAAASAAVPGTLTSSAAAQGDLPSALGVAADGDGATRKQVGTGDGVQPVESGDGAAGDEEEEDMDSDDSESSSGSDDSWATRHELDAFYRDMGPLVGVHTSVAIETASLAPQAKAALPHTGQTKTGQAARGVGPRRNGRRLASRTEAAHDMGARSGSTHAQDAMNSVSTFAQPHRRSQQPPRRQPLGVGAVVSRPEPQRVAVASSTSAHEAVSAAAPALSSASTRPVPRLPLANRLPHMRGSDPTSVSLPASPNSARSPPRARSSLHAHARGRRSTSGPAAITRTTSALAAPVHRHTHDGPDRGQSWGWGRGRGEYADHRALQAQQQQLQQQPSLRAQPHPQDYSQPWVKRGQRVWAPSRGVRAAASSTSSSQAPRPRMVGTGGSEVVGSDSSGGLRSSGNGRHHTPSSPPRQGWPRASYVFGPRRDRERGRANERVSRRARGQGAMNGGGARGNLVATTGGGGGQRGSLCAGEAGTMGAMGRGGQRNKRQQLEGDRSGSWRSRARGLGSGPTPPPTKNRLSRIVSPRLRLPAGVLRPK